VREKNTSSDVYLAHVSDAIVASPWPCIPNRSWQTLFCWQHARQANRKAAASVNRC